MHNNRPNPGPKRSIDGMLGGSPTRQPMSPHRPAQVHPRQTPTVQATLTARPTPKTPFWKKAVKAIGQTLLFVLLLLFGLVIQSPLIGQMAVLLYAVAALIWRIRSRTTFFMVLGCLMVVLFASARSDITLASTFAMYALLLLIIATISLAFEVRSEI